MSQFASPALEVDIDEGLVRALLESQFAHIAHLPLTEFAAGFDNVVYRAGDEYLIRLPRRKTAVELLKNEQRVLTNISHLLPCPVPAPLYVGSSEHGFPWTWSVVPWIDGEIAAQAALSRDGALQLAEFFATLHNLSGKLYPADATPNRYRGIPVVRRKDAVEERAKELAKRGEALSSVLQDVWRTALSAPMSLGPVIVHGDPHARNVLTHEGHLAAVIDWGDTTFGDAASDLACFWMLVHDPEHRVEAVQRYQALAAHSDGQGGMAALLDRSRGWALLYGALLRVTGLTDNPVHARMGASTLTNLAQVY